MCPVQGEHVRWKIAALVGVLLLGGIVQTTSMRAAADISESFETDFGGWTGNMNYDWAFFSVDRSSIYAYDGLYSVKMQAHGLPPPYPQMTVWIERQLQVPANVAMDIGVTFYLYNENTTYAAENVVAYFGDYAPTDYPDFTVIGQTQTTVGWKYFSYQTNIMTPANGQIYAAIGFYNHITGFKFFFFDLVNLTGVSLDFTPPTISNLQPLNQTMISDSTPQIAASYSDASGIDTSKILLKVDSTDVTSLSTVTASDIAYTPSVPMAQGLHNVYLEVKDNSANQNKAVATWRFTVDSIAPTIANMAPANHSTVGGTMPPIGAGYSDTNGVNTSLVVLEVDSVDVTASSTVQPTFIDYTPTTALSQGVHDVRLSVGDNSNPPNIAVALWQFTVDSLPPSIVNQRPASSSTVSNNKPQIGADYSDPSSIDTSTVRLIVDGADVTSSAFVTITFTTYTPSAPLAEGDHTVWLQVRDDSPAHNMGIASWSFRIDSLAPTIVNLRPANNSATNDATPLIAANYMDDSGIATAAVVLTVDSVNVTASAVVSSSEVLYTPSTPLSDGLHDVLVSVRDASPNHLLASASWSFTTDTTPPATTLTPLIPNHFDSGTGRTYVSSATLLRLTATDAGVGVQTTVYKFYAWDETPPSSYITGTEFSIPSSKADGLIIVKFKSTDSLGNGEPEQTVQLYLDNAPPAADATGFSSTAIMYLNNALALITIDSSDAGSGVQTVYYGVDDDTCPQTYTAAIAANVAGEGEHRVHYRAKDNVGNMAIVRFAWIFLDTQAPTAEADVDQKVDLGTDVIFDGTGSVDNSGGSGIINYTWAFTYEDDMVILYGSQPQFKFQTRGDYEVVLTVRDRAGNTNTDSMRVTFNADTGSGTSGMSIGGLPVWTVGLLIAIIVIVLALVVFMTRRKKDEEPEAEDSPLACASCGRELTADDESCPDCGTPVGQIVEATEE